MYNVIGWQAVVFGINSTSIVNTKGKAEHYFLPVHNVKTVYAK